MGALGEDELVVEEVELDADVVGEVVRLLDTPLLLSRRAACRRCGGPSSFMPGTGQYLTRLRTGAEHTEGATCLGALSRSGGCGGQATVPQSRSRPARTTLRLARDTEAHGAPGKAPGRSKLRATTLQRNKLCGC